MSKGIKVMTILFEDLKKDSLYPKSKEEISFNAQQEADSLIDAESEILKQAYPNHSFGWRMGKRGCTIYAIPLD